MALNTVLYKLAVDHKCAMSWYWGAMTVYHKGIGNSLRGHRGILKINLINGDLRSRLVGSNARCHGCR